MKAAQNGRCAICTEVKPLSVDHHHGTKRVRGMLCKSCNFGLGSFHDNIRFLQAAIDYLSKQ